MPKVLHASWSSGRLHLWAEDARQYAVAASSSTAASTHPFAKGDLSWLAALPALRDAQPAQLVARLPFLGETPAPSTALERLAGSALAGDDDVDFEDPSALADAQEDVAAAAAEAATVVATITLRDCKIDTLAFGPDQTSAVLLALADALEKQASGEDTDKTHERVAIGSDLEYWILAGRFAQHVIAQQRFVPMLVQTLTGELKGGWRPVAPLLIKFSYGTSFRAPNLRENFLLSQSGFGNIADPCAVPSAAFRAGTGYSAVDDTRDPAILANCRREGRDPTRVGIDELGLNTIQATSVQVFSGGSLDIQPETSRSITTGFAFEEDWASGFRFAFNFNYYDIKLKDSIIEPSGAFIVADCYSRLDGNRSPFCDRITASDQASARFLITQVQSGFINLDQESVRGIDLNTTFGYPVMIGNEEFDLSLNLTANHLIERSTTTRDAAGNRTTDNFAGRFAFPSWIGRATFNVRYDDFLFTWQTRYIGDVSQDPNFVDAFSDAFGFGPDGQPTGFVANTCLGGGSRTNGVQNGIVAGDGVYCRNVGFANEWFEHTASVRWDNDDFRVILGVTNVFNTAPPRVDSAEVFAIANTPLGAGYNLNGREFFGQLLVRF